MRGKGDGELRVVGDLGRGNWSEGGRKEMGTAGRGQFEGRGNRCEKRAAPTPIRTRDQVNGVVRHGGGGEERWRRDGRGR